MDSFSEQLVKKREDSSDTMKRMLLIGGGIGGVVGLFLLTVFLTPFAIIAIAGVIFGVYYLLTNTYIEYEYIISNEYLDIDKIIAKRRRTTLLSIDIREMYEFGEYKEQPYDGTTYSAVGGDEPLMYGMFKSKDYGEGRLVFAPNEKTLENLKKYLKVK